MVEAPIPLARLFVMGAGHLVSRMHERLAAEGWDEVRPAYGFVLSRLRDDSSTITALSAFLGVTKQAGSKLIERMAQLDLVAISPHPDDSRAKAVAITPEGARLLATVEGIYTELEAAWAGVIGREAIETMREDLTQVLRAMNGGDLPPMRPI